MKCGDCSYYSNLYPMEGIGQCVQISNGVDDPFVYADDCSCRALDGANEDDNE